MTIKSLVLFYIHSIMVIYIYIHNWMLFFCSKNGSVLHGQQGILQGKKWYNLFVCNGFGDDIGYISGGKWCNWQHCWRCCQFLVEWLTTLDVFQWYRALARSTREESLLRKKWSGRSAIKNNSDVFVVEEVGAAAQVPL